MPAIVHSAAVITILIEVKNSDGSAFTYSRTGTAKWSTGLISERRTAMKDAVMDQADQFIDLNPVEVTNF